MKKCPFKKEVNYYNEYASGDIFRSSINSADFSREEFLPCIKEKCMAWETELKVCLKIAVFFPDGEGKQIPMSGPEDS
jgi:hypothetical protein